MSFWTIMDFRRFHCDSIPTSATESNFLASVLASSFFQIARNLVCFFLMEFLTKWLLVCIPWLPQLKFGLL